MPFVTFRCPCGQRLRAERTAARVQARCPGCGRVLLVTDGPVPALPVPPRSPLRRRAAALGLGLFFLLALIAGFTAGRGGTRRPEASVPVPPATAAEQLPPATEPVATPTDRAASATQPAEAAPPPAQTRRDEPAASQPSAGGEKQAPDDAFPPSPPVLSKPVEKVVLGEPVDEPNPVVARLNALRKAAGLGPVQLDAGLSRDCAAHARYVALNVGEAAPGTDWSDEQPDRPGFTEGGRRAARVGWGGFLGPGQDPAADIDVWAGAVRSRGPLLDPALRRVGYGEHELGRQGSFALLDLYHGTGPDQIVFYPSDGQSEVPTDFAGNEVPDPIPESPDKRAGYPVTVIFPRGARVEGLTLTLRDADGRAVPAWVSTPEKPVLADHQANTACLIAKRPLRSATRYTAEAAGSVAGKPWSRKWTFATWDEDELTARARQRFLARLNGARAAAELKPATLDEELSRGCAAHARYLVRNADHPSTRGGTREEDPALPGYSEEGARAAKDAFLGFDGGDPTVAGLDDPLAMFFPRLYLLAPGLRSVGFGCARDPGRNWVAVVAPSPERGPHPRGTVVLHPPPDADRVPVAYLRTGRESPSPLPENHQGPAGYPITAVFAPAARVRDAGLTLTDAAGRAVAGRLTTPQRPFAQRFQNNAVCFVPDRPLRPATRYRVALQATLDGEPWERSWQFTTGDDGLPPQEEMERRVLARLNAYRALAGVPPVAGVDRLLSERCRAHARYLVRNVGRPELEGLSMHEEDPGLPGYSAAGHAAGRASVISTADPVRSVDQWMATFYHRVPLLHPELRRVGVGAARADTGELASVLDVKTGVGRGEPVCYPGDNQTGVPLACTKTDDLRQLVPEFRGGRPGYPVTVAFPRGTTVRKGALALSRDGERVEAWLLLPDGRQEKHFDRPTLVALPRKPLEPGVTYNVAATAEVNGAAWERSWQFTTRGPGRKP